MHQLGLYKGKDKDRALYTSYRDLGLATVPGKITEGVALARADDQSFVDEFQAVAQMGGDVRLVLLLLQDHLAYRTAHGLATYTFVLDVKSGFPTTRTLEALLALHDEGVRGHVLAMLPALGLDVKVFLRVGHGRTMAQPIDEENGMTQGPRGSPRKFVGVTGGISRVVRASDLGCKLKFRLLNQDHEINLTDLGFMDDYASLCGSPEEALAMFPSQAPSCGGQSQVL